MNPPSNVVSALICSRRGGVYPPRGIYAGCKDILGGREGKRKARQKGAAGGGEGVNKNKQC